MVAGWHQARLIQSYWQEVQKLFTNYRTYQANHPFWLFYWAWKKNRWSCIKQLRQARLLPQPMIGYKYWGESEPMWSYQDSIIQKMIYKILKTTFKHNISPCCVHLKGPGIIKTVTADIYQALENTDYRYITRTILIPSMPLSIIGF